MKIINAFRAGKRLLDLTTLPQVNLVGSPWDCDGEFRILWDSGWWDGPLSGMCRWRGQDLWFELYEEVWHDLPEDSEEMRYTRWYVLYSLTSEQMTDRLYWRDLFREYVGNQNHEYDLTPEQKAQMSLRPHHEWRKYYDATEKADPMDLSLATAVGVWKW